MDHIDIARDVVITAKTVEKHTEHILLKLGVHSRAQAIALRCNRSESSSRRTSTSRRSRAGRRGAVD